jgi:hypothetical protein
MQFAFTDEQERFRDAPLRVSEGATTGTLFDAAGGFSG